MATTVSVSRRFVKMKNRPKHRPPQMPMQSGTGDAVVRSASLLSAVPRQPEKLPWYRSTWAILGLFAMIIGLLALMVMLGAGKLVTRYDDESGATVSGASNGESQTRRSKSANAKQTNAGQREGVVIRHDLRPLPDERSFMATPYAKHSAAQPAPTTTLPENVSGKCVVTGTSAADLQKCLQSHGGR